jgi:hypothetical protein
MIDNAKKILKLSDAEKKEILPYTIVTLQKVLELKKEKKQTNLQNSEFVDNIRNRKLFSINDLHSSVHKEYGAFYLLEGISDQVRLKESLIKAFPADWKEILTLAYFLVSTHDSVLYFQNWYNEVEGYPISIPKINTLLNNIDNNQINNFYTIWQNLKTENDLLSLNISTFLPQYSDIDFEDDLEDDLEDDKLSQLNICVLIDSISKLPLSFNTYSDSINDISALKSNLESIYYSDKHKLSLILDNNFANANNITEMLEGPQKNNFLILLPLCLNYALKSNLSFTKSTSIPCHNVSFANNIWASTADDFWMNDYPVILHVYYFNYDYNYTNDIINDEIEDFFFTLTEQCVSRSGLIKLNNHVIINKDENNHFNDYSPRSGLFLLLSNFIKDSKEAFHIYRTKDVIEQGFSKFLRQLDLQQLTDTSDKVTETKLLLSFISLILLSSINNVLLKNNLFITYTAQSLINQMEDLHIINIKGCSFLNQLSSTQKDILKLFNLKEPKIFDFDYSILKTV